MLRLCLRRGACLNGISNEFVFFDHFLERDWFRFFLNK